MIDQAKKPEESIEDRYIKNAKILIKKVKQSMPDSEFSTEERLLVCEKLISPFYYWIQDSLPNSDMNQLRALSNWNKKVVDYWLWRMEKKNLQDLTKKEASIILDYLKQREYDRDDAFKRWMEK